MDRGALSIPALKICSHRNCGNTQPCPVPGHAPKPWEQSSRRDKLRTTSGSRQQKLARAVMARDDGICHVCGKGGADEVDHVLALSEGGTDTFENRAPIHHTPCHRDKTAAEAKRARTG